MSTAVFVSMSSMSARLLTATVTVGFIMPPFFLNDPLGHKKVRVMMLKHKILISFLCSGERENGIKYVYYGECLIIGAVRGSENIR